jgi:hypothetical protein
MDCLINYIGLKDCGTPPESGIYINNLPGLNTEIVGAIADGEEITHKGVWSDVNKISARRFQTDIMGSLRKSYKLKRIRQTFEFIPEEGTSELGSAEYRGLLLGFNYQYFTFQAFLISTVYLYSDTAGTSTLKIFNRQNEELYSVAVDVVEGLNAYQVNDTFISDRLFVGFDFTNIDGFSSDISSNVSSCFCQALLDVFCDTCNPSFGGATKSGATITSTSLNAHGVGILGNAGCDYAQIVCNNKQIFTSAWLYLLGNQLLIHLLNADRLNKYTTADVAKYNELKDYYQVMYEKSLEEAVLGIELDAMDDCCIECAPLVKSVQWLP